MKAQIKYIVLSVVAAGTVIGGAIWFIIADARAEQRSAEVTRDYRLHDPDVVACRQHNGMPVFSGWSGLIIDCKPLQNGATANAR